MIAIDFTNRKLPFYQFDTKSEVSTQGDQNSDYSSFETFCLTSRNSQSSKIPKSKLKSSLCRNFTQKGTCPYGARCQFAHGTEELRINENTNNSYKTKPCTAFFKKGHCQYGYRCNFVHSRPEECNEDKWRVMQENHRQVFENLKEKQGSKLLRILE